MNTKQKKQTSAPKKIKRSEKDRRQIFTLDHFFNPENERRENIKDRRRELDKSKAKAGPGEWGGIPSCT